MDAPAARSTGFTAGRSNSEIAELAASRRAPTALADAHAAIPDEPVFAQHSKASPQPVAADKATVQTDSASSAVQRKGKSQAAPAAKGATTQSPPLDQFNTPGKSRRPSSVDHAINDGLKDALRVLFQKRGLAVESFKDQSVLKDLPPASAIRSLLVLAAEVALASASAGLTVYLSGSVLTRLKGAGHGPLARTQMVKSMVGAASKSVVRAGVDSVFDKAVKRPTTRAHIAYASIQAAYLSLEQTRLSTDRTAWLREKAAELESSEPGLGVSFVEGITAAIRKSALAAEKLQYQESLNGWIVLMSRAQLGRHAKNWPDTTAQDGTDLGKVTDHSSVATPREPTGRLAWESAKQPKGAHRTPGVLRLRLRASGGARRGKHWTTDWNSVRVKIEKATIAGLNKELREELSGRPLGSLPIPMTAWFVYDAGFTSYMIGRNEAGDCWADTNDPKFAELISKRAGRKLSPTEAARYIFEVELANERPSIGPA